MKKKPRVMKVHKEARNAYRNAIAFIDQFGINTEEVRFQLELKARGLADPTVGAFVSDGSDL